MKNRIIRNYFIRILVYTSFYVGAIIIVEKFSNGVIISYLCRMLGDGIFWPVYENRGLIMTLVWGLGVFLISVLYVFKMSRLLRIATCSIEEEEPFQEKCPEELADYSTKLKEFKYNLKVNEQARLAAEQQKNDLIVYLAHDLKTPLTSVIGYLTLLTEAPELPPEQRAKYTGIAMEKAYRLEQLINEFFDITRLNLQNIPTQKSPVNLTIVLIQIISEFYPMMEEKKITVRQEIAPELVIFADADKLARVFDNLFRNAVNYSYPETEIVCSAEKCEEGVQIRIRNMGEHIPSEKLQHIFDKFYRLDFARQSATGGAGLGLAIAKQIVELHGGSITATCEGGTTEFCILLEK